MKHATKKSWRSIEVRIPIHFFWHRIALGYAKFFLVLVMEKVYSSWTFLASYLGIYIDITGHALGIWICGCSLFYKRELWASKSEGAHSTKSLKISGCKRWCPKDLRVHAPVLTHSLHYYLPTRIWKTNDISADILHLLNIKFHLKRHGECQNVGTLLHMTYYFRISFIIKRTLSNETWIVRI